MTLACQKHLPGVQAGAPETATVQKSWKIIIKVKITKLINVPTKVMVSTARRHRPALNLEKRIPNRKALEVTMTM